MTQRFEVTGDIGELLDSHAIADDNAAYEVADVVEVLKELFAGYVSIPEGTWAGCSRHQDSDGYFVVVQVPGQQFFLCSKVHYPGNANGVAYSDFRAEIGLALADANHMLDSWRDR